MLGTSSKGFSTPIQQQNKIDRFEFSKAANYLEPIPLQTCQSHENGFPNSIGEYGMGRLLGRGAFGSVYEVTEIRHKTPLNEFKYAIKIVSKHLVIFSVIKSVFVDGKEIY